MKRLLFTAATAAVVPASAWIVGFNFDERGWNAFVVFYMTMVAGIIGWAWAGRRRR